MLRAGRAWYSSLNRPYLTFRQFTASFVTPKRACSTGKLQKGALGSVIDMDKKEQTSVAEGTAQVGQAGGQSTPEKKKTGGRSMCSRCGRVLKVCVCSVLPREKIKLPVNVIVVQHPNEAKRPQVCSVPIIKAVVENCHVIVGHAFPPGKSEILDRALASSETLLLYPGKDSVPIDKFYVDAKAWTKQDAPAENSTEIDNCGVAEPAAPADGGDAKTGTPVRDLILVDGTWRCAKKIMRYNKRLTSVHRVHCKVTREGQFKFRQEPRNGYVSTLEALCFALSQLDETRFDEPCKAMLKGFDEMVSIQCSYISNHGTPRKEGQRKPIPVPPRRPTGEDTKGIDIKDGANSASSTTSVPAAELRGARRYVRTWGGGFEEEIHRFVREAQLDDAEMKRLQAKSDNIRFEWSLCETVNRIDATQTYRELFRMEKINYRDAIRAAKLANGHQSRGNRVTVISSKRLQDSAGPEMLLPPGVKSREPITWKGRGLREPQHRE